MGHRFIRLLSAAPSPVGVGQEVYVFCWVDLPFTGAGVNNDIRRHDYKLTITDPDGVNTTQTWAVVDDTTGVQAYAFTPTKVGNYTLLLLSRPNTHLDRCIAKATYYHGSFSFKNTRSNRRTNSTVTQGATLPTEYWSRPINGQNSNWYTIASNWLNHPKSAPAQQPPAVQATADTSQTASGPEAPHVLWTKAHTDRRSSRRSNTMNDR